MKILFISPTGAGRRDGSSWSNAGTLNRLSDFIEAAGPGGEVLLRADEGAYGVASTVSVSSGGSATAGVTVRGSDGGGRPMKATIVGTRAPEWALGLPEGREVFRLGGGADHLTFQDISFAHVGNGAFRVGADISDLTLERMTATNVGRFLENYVSGSATSATIAGLTVQDVEIEGYSKGAIRLRYDTHDVTIENVTGDSQRQQGGLYVVGVHLEGTVHDVLIRHVTMQNNDGRGSAGNYWNGDGFTSERGVHDVRFEDTAALGNTDAGYDLKSRDTVLVRTLAEGNARNYRFWSDSITVEEATSLNPIRRGGTTIELHLWFGAGAEAVVRGLSFADATWPRTFIDLEEGNASIHLSGTVIPLAYLGLIRVGAGSQLDIEPAVNRTPVAIEMSGGAIDENAPGGTGVATLAAIDPDIGDRHSFSIVGGASQHFELVGSELRVKSGALLDYETARSHHLTVRVTDVGGLSKDVDFEIRVRDLAEPSEPRPVTRLVGDEGDDKLKANNQSNALEGRGGSDQLYAYGGDDLMSGGTGADHLYGGGGDDRIDAGTGADKIFAGRGDDRVFGGEGPDRLKGEGGQDILEGGAGADELTGGADIDLFRYVATSDSAGADADRIVDFEQGVDRLDLAGIDARTDRPADQAFVLIGTSAFSGEAGQLRAERTADGTLILGDVDGNGTADLRILLLGRYALSEGEFIF